MAQRDLQAFVIYAEIPHTLTVIVPMDWTVGALKKRIHDEMETHMGGLLPDIQLDLEYCDIFPGRPFLLYPHPISTVWFFALA